MGSLKTDSQVRKADYLMNFLMERAIGLQFLEVSFAHRFLSVLFADAHR